MFNNLPPLPWLRAFEASARLGNFTRAGEELGLTPSAVSYQIRALEASLGHKLFERGGKRLDLTRLGQSYLPVVTRGFALIDTGTSGVFGLHRPSVVTLRCVSSFNLLWLVPRLDRFRARHPEVALRLLSASWSEAGDHDPIDIDIRYGDGTWTDGTVLPLLRGEVLPLAAPGLGGSLDRIAEGPLIEITGVVDTWGHFFRQSGREGPPPAPALVVDQSLIALEMAALGQGYALVSEVFAEPYVAAGRLAPACAARIEERLGHHLILPHARNTHRPEIAALVAWLREEAAASALPPAEPGPR